MTTSPIRHSYLNQFMFEFFLLLLERLASVSSNCVSCGKTSNIDTRKAESTLGVNPNEILPPVGVDVKPNVRTDDKSTNNKICCPYDYDGTYCIENDDRILCGYNKNHGKLESASHSVDNGNGCYTRNKILECGYLLPPYDGIRRPPARDNSSPGKKGPEENESETGTTTHPPDPKVVEDTTKPGLRVEDSAKQIESVTDMVSGVTKCIEINSRIVCNVIKDEVLPDKIKSR